MIESCRRKLRAVRAFAAAPSERTMPGMRTVAKLFLLFTCVTAVEVYLLLELAQLTSWWVTVATIFVPGLVGAWLARREGAKAWREVRRALALQREPTGAILDGVIVLVAAVLLITPGVLTDLTGLALLLPPVRRVTREYARARLSRAIDRRVAGGTLSVKDLVDYGATGGAGSYEVIDAEDIPKPS